MSATVVAYEDLIRAVASTLGNAEPVQRTTSLDTLVEEPMDFPMLRVYPKSGELSSGSSTDRKAFAGGSGVKPLRQEDFVIFVDLYVRARSHIGDDMMLTVKALDAVTNVLNNQDRKPYFGHQAIKAFHWLWEQVEFAYGTGEAITRYVGIRFTLTLTIF